MDAKFWIYVYIVEFYLAISIYGKPAPEPWYGDYIGELEDIQKVGLKGYVYVVNDTCLQLIGFTYHGNSSDCRGDLYFWIDYEGALTHKGVKLITFEYGHKAIGKYENARVVISLTNGANVSHFSNFGLWCQLTSTNYGYVTIPKDLKPPHAQFLEHQIKPAMGTSRYKMSSGPILIMDRRTIKIYAFTIAYKSPPIFFVVGKGTSISKRTLTKVPIRDDIQYNPIPTTSNNGYMDFIIDLPEEYDIYNIDWLAVWCEKLSMNFGHVDLTKVSDRIPPFLPIDMKFSQHDQPMDEGWARLYVFGNKYKNNLTFQLGAPGGRNGYARWTNSEPPRYVWYINGLMAPELWLEKDVTYNFIIEGGDDTSMQHLYNPLYISNDTNGGYSMFSSDARKKVTVFAGLNSKGEVLYTENSKSFGSGCVWLEREGIKADNYDSFRTYHTALTLKCLPGKPGHFQWKPSTKDSLPDILYYQSYTQGGMGGKIVLSQDTSDAKEDSVGGFKREETTKDRIPFGPKETNQRLAKDFDNVKGTGVSFLQNDRRFFYTLSFIFALLML